MRVQYSIITIKDSTYFLENYIWNSNQSDWDVVNKMKTRDIYPTADSAMQRMISYWDLNNSSWRDSVYSVFEYSTPDSMKFITYVASQPEGTWIKSAKNLQKFHGTLLTDQKLYHWIEESEEWKILINRSIDLDENNRITNKSLILYDQNQSRKMPICLLRKGTWIIMKIILYDTTFTDNWKPYFREEWNYDLSIESKNVMWPRFALSGTNAPS